MQFITTIPTFTTEIKNGAVVSQPGGRVPPSLGNGKCLLTYWEKRGKEKRENGEKGKVEN